MVTDLKYTDNIVLKRQAYQELLTGIKHYPIIDVDYIEEWDTDERTNRLVWSGYTDGSPCIKITYGDPQTVKGNIIFSKEFRKAINELNKDYESLQNAIAAKEAYLERLRKIYNDNNEILIREQTYLNAYEDAQLTAAASDAEELEDKLAQLIQMMANVAHANPQTGEQFEAFGQNTVTEINFTKTWLTINGTAWTTAMLETDPDMDIFYMPSRYFAIEDGSVFYACKDQGILQAYKYENKKFYKLKNDTNEWIQTDELPEIPDVIQLQNQNNEELTNFVEMYVFTPIRRIEGLERKANENIGDILLYHDYDNIRINVAIPLYRMAYSKYVAAGLGPNHTPANPDEQAIYNFYNNIIEFINLLEAYETNWGTFKSRNYDSTTNPDYRTANIGSRFTSLQNWVKQYINQTFIKELTNKCLVTAEHYNINYHGGSGSNTTPVQYRDSYLGMQERLGEVANLIDVYEGYVDSIASGKTIINPEWVEIYNDGDIQWYEQLTENYIYDSTQEYYKQPNSDPNNLFNLETAKQEAFNEIKNRQDNRVKVVDKDNGQEAVIYNSAKSYIVQFVTVVQGATTVVSSQTLEEFAWLDAIDKGLYFYKENASVSDIDVNRVPGVIKNEGSGIDRRMFGYKYIPVGNEIDFFNNLLGVNYNPSRNDGDFIYPEVNPQSPQRYGTFRTTINGHTYEIGIRGLEQSDEHDIKIIASNYEQVPKNAVYDANTKYYYLDDNGNYVEYDESIHGLWNTARNSDRLFTKPAAGKVQIEASDEIIGTAPEISFGGDNINLIADDHMIQYAGEDITTTAGQQITIDAPIVNINGQDNLNITSINEFSYEQVPEGTPYDPNEKYYQQDENGKYIRYIYDPNTWEQDVADGKVYTKFLNEPTEIHYGDINILGQDVYIRDPNDNGPIEERGLGKIHAIADYASADDTEYYIFDTTKFNNELDVNDNGHFLIPIDTISPQPIKIGSMVKTPDNYYYLMHSIIDTDNDEQEDTCICIYLGQNINLPTNINDKFVRLDGNNLPLYDSNGNILYGDEEPDFLKKLNRFMTGKYVRIPGDTMTGTLNITIDDAVMEQKRRDAIQEEIDINVLQNKIDVINNLMFNENNNVKQRAYFSLDLNKIKINELNLEDIYENIDAINPELTLNCYVQPLLANPTQIISKQNDSTTVANYKDIGALSSNDGSLILMSTIQPEDETSIPASIILKHQQINMDYTKSGSSKYTITYDDSKDFSYSNFLLYNKVTPYISLLLKNENAVNTKSQQVIDIDFCNFSTLLPQYTIYGLDQIVRMIKSSATFTNAIVTQTDVDNAFPILDKNDEETSEHPDHYTNTNFLYNALSELYKREYFGDINIEYKMGLQNYIDSRVSIYPYNTIQSNGTKPARNKISLIHLLADTNSFVYKYDPVYFIYWGRIKDGTTTTTLKYLLDDGITMTSRPEYEGPIYGLSYETVENENAFSRYFIFNNTDIYQEHPIDGQWTATNPALTPEDGDLYYTGRINWNAYMNGTMSDSAVYYLTGTTHKCTNGIELQNNQQPIKDPTISFYNFYDQSYEEISEWSNDYNIFYFNTDTSTYVQVQNQEEANNYSKLFKQTNSPVVDLYNTINNFTNSELINSFIIDAWKKHYENYLNYISIYNLKKNDSDWSTYGSENSSQYNEYNTLLQLSKSSNFIKKYFTTVYKLVYLKSPVNLKNQKDYIRIIRTIKSNTTQMSVSQSYTGALPYLLKYNIHGYTHYFSYYDTEYPTEVIRNIGSLSEDYYIIKAMRPKIEFSGVSTDMDINTIGNQTKIIFNDNTIDLNLFNQTYKIYYNRFYPDLDTNNYYKFVINQINLFNPIAKETQAYQRPDRNSFILNSLEIKNNTTNYYPYDIKFVPLYNDVKYSNVHTNSTYGLGFLRKNYANLINWDQIRSTNNARTVTNTDWINVYNSDGTGENAKILIPNFIPYYNINIIDGEQQVSYNSNASKFIYPINVANNKYFITTNSIEDNSITSQNIVTAAQEGVNYQTTNNIALEVKNGLSKFNSYVQINVNDYEQKNLNGDLIYGLKDTQKPVPEASALNVDGAGYFSKSLVANRVYNAVFNDYAECRTTINLSPGHAVIDNDDGTLSCTTARLQPGAQIISDTFGTSMGETETTKTPLAVAGRVLAYPYRNRYDYHAGMAVCSAPGGTVDIMTREEIKEYPDCIIGIVSEIPEYKVWGTANVEVNNRIWIKVK